jgi:hypothetical protein
VLEEFLAHQASEGALESRGAFTISASEARRKMSQSGLDSGQKGLLKLVQLGVDSQCASLKVSLGADNITFTYQDPVRGLLDDHYLGEELQSALLACVYSGFAHATFQTDRFAWRLHKEKIEPISDRMESPGAVRVVLRRWQPSGFWDALRHSLAGRTEDYTTFLSHLGYCPIPLELDGARPFTETRTEGARALELRLWGPSGLRHSGVRTPFDDSSYLVRHSEFGGLVPNADKVWTTFGLVEKVAESRFFAPELPAWAEAPGPPLTALGLLYTPLDWPQGGLIDVVEKGVLVGRLSWPFEGHVSGVISCLGMDTDLSGLALVHNRKTTEMLDYLGSEVVNAAKLLEGHPETTSTVRERLEGLGQPLPDHLRDSW